MNLDVVKFLLQEIEDEITYNQEFEKHKQYAIEKHKEVGYGYWNYMPREFQREPRKSVIKQNAMQIRRLLLKLYESN